MTATIYPGTTYAADGQITPVNLTNMVRNATVGGIGRPEMEAGFYGVTTSTTEPAVSLAVGEPWFDSTEKVLKCRVADGGPVASMVRVQEVRLTYRDVTGHGNLQPGDIVHKIPVGQLQDDEVMATNGENSNYVAGVALETCQTGQTVRIARSGVVTVNFVSGQAVLRCTGVYSSDLASGKAKSTLIPPFGDGSFGIWLETKVTGSSALALIRGVR